LVKTCVQNEVGLGMFSKNIKAQLTQLQGSTSPYGLREPVTAKKDVSLEESLNNSIKSVITETINKNNNKNLDSIIKNNLRRYIR
jgi:flagellar motor component MotA